MKSLQKSDAFTNHCVSIIVCIQNFNNCFLPCLLCHRTDRVICHISAVFFLKLEWFLKQCWWIEHSLWFLADVLALPQFPCHLQTMIVASTFETQPKRFRPWSGIGESPISSASYSACTKHPSTRVDTISIEGYSTLNGRKSKANQTVSMKKKWKTWKKKREWRYKLEV